MNYTEEDVERGAMAMLKAMQVMSRINIVDWAEQDEDIRDEYRTMLRAALSSIPRQDVPEGWVMVPKNPTPEMERAGDGRLLKGAFAVWATMLASAPPHPKEEPQC